MQVRYAATSIDNAKSARARGSYLRTSFKNTRETAQAINGWRLERALTFLNNVLEHKEAVPFRTFNRGVGRTSQSKAFYLAPQARWPKKSAEFLLNLLQNAESNAEVCLSIDFHAEEM